MLAKGIEEVKLEQTGQLAAARARLEERPQQDLHAEQDEAEPRNLAVDVLANQTKSQRTSLGLERGGNESKTDDQERCETDRQEARGNLFRRRLNDWQPPEVSEKETPLLRSMKQDGGDRN
jgi:hypothetical protein